jgi:abortive infection bacteriophage resistance protein
MQFDKRPLTISEQVALLEQRGLHIPDKPLAEKYLSSISYYRLSAYWFTFLQEPKNEHRFTKGADFKKVIDTYVFDRKLRLLIFDEIERLEIAVRARIIYYFCHAFGNNWYEDANLYRKKEQFLKFQRLLNDEMKRTSEVFVKHYRDKYTEPKNPPTWMALELASLGQLSMLFKNLKNSDAKKQVADYFGVHENILESWLETLSYVRNTSAHHMRLWNRKLPKAPTWPKRTDRSWVATIPDNQYQNRLYAALCIIRYMLGVVIPESSFSTKLKYLLDQYPNIPRQYMGFTENWKNESLWQ